MASVFKRLHGKLLHKLQRKQHKANLPALRPELAHLKAGGQAVQKLIDDYEFSTLLDVGSGQGLHARAFVAAGKEVTAIDYGKSIYAEKHEDGGGFDVVWGDIHTHEFNQKFDCVWASHVLEHQINPGIFLQRLASLLKEGGVIAITVPPLKHKIVGGHVTLWNPGLLLYQMILAGIDCSEAAILQYGYNISVIARVKTIELPELVYDNGDVDRLKAFFPPGISEPFDGDILRMNW